MQRSRLTCAQPIFKKQSEALGGSCKPAIIHPNSIFRGVTYGIPVSSAPDPRERSFRHVGDLQSEPPEEESGAYHTLSGFILMRLGRIPAVAEHFEWRGWRFEVVDMDGNRIDKVLASHVQ